LQYRRVTERGWDVLPSFDQLLSRELFDEVQNHPLIAGESGWGVRNLLHALILSTRPAIVVELGAQIGAAALVIGLSLRCNDFGKSYHLEPQDHYYRVLRDFIGRAGLDDYAYPLQMHSSDPALTAMIDREADLVFVDASQTYSGAYGDLMTCDSLLSEHGIALVNTVGNPQSSDVCDEGRGGVRQALLDFIAARPEFSVIFLEPPFWLNPCGLAIMARKPPDQHARLSLDRFVSVEAVD
jgi:predicted O-methyltransferase YrrM